MKRIYELSDIVLNKMLKDPTKEYYRKDLEELVDCGEEEFGSNICDITK